MPKKQIRDSTATLLIFLSQNLADRCQRFTTETLDDLNQVVQCKRPIDANGAGSFLRFSRVYIADNPFGFAVGDFDQAVVDFRCAGWVECVGMEVKWAGLERSLEDVRDVGKKDIVEEIAELVVLDIGLWIGVCSVYQGLNDPTLCVVAFPSMVSIPA